VITKKIGSITLGKIPRIVAVIDSITPISDIRDLTLEGVTILELRVDHFCCSTENTIEFMKSIRCLNKYGILCTLRENKKNKKSRLRTLGELIPHADAVDIEMDSPIKLFVIKQAKSQGKTVILSYHNFKNTPAEKTLERFLHAFKLGADLLKVAVMAKTNEDVLTLLQFCRKHRDKGIIGISMGSCGVISRYVAPFFGSVMTYGYIRSSVAPGQVSVGQLKNRLSLDSPKFNEDYINSTQLLRMI
jgi:3-dehydroquinate dehydratase-1